MLEVKYNSYCIGNTTFDFLAAGTTIPPLPSATSGMGGEETTQSTPSGEPLAFEH